MRAVYNAQHARQSDDDYYHRADNIFLHTLTSVSYLAVDHGNVSLGSDRRERISRPDDHVAVLADLKAFYDGYRFVPDAEPLYNSTICNWYLFNFDPNFAAEYEPENWEIAVNNENFRKAIFHAIDRTNYIAARYPGDDPEMHKINCVTPTGFSVNNGKDFTMYGDLAKFTTEREWRTIRGRKIALGLDDVKFLPYWKKDAALRVSSDNPAIKLSVYEKPNGDMLVAVFNSKPGDETFTLNIHSKSANAEYYDPLTDKSTPWQAGKKFTVGKYLGGLLTVKR